MGDRDSLDSCAIPVYRFYNTFSRQSNVGDSTSDPCDDWKHSNGIADNNSCSQIVHFFNMMNKNCPADTCASNPNEDFQCDDDDDSMDTSSTGPSQNLAMGLYDENDQMQITSQMDQISISDMVLTPDITLTDVDGPVFKPAVIQHNHREDGTFLTVPQPEVETEPRRPPIMM